MSRILRRPMFRGGQVIDSRGTGITSGLMDGGRVGYNTGNIVLGSDLLSKANLPTNLSDLNKLKFSAASPVVFTGAAKENIKEKVEDEVEKPADVMKGSVIDKFDASKEADKIGSNVLDSDFDVTERVDGKIVTKPQPELSAKAKVNLGLIDRDEYNRLTKLEAAEKAKQEKSPEAKVLIDDDDLKDLKNINNNQEQPTELSAKEMVAENKKLFAEMLGMDKARSSDIGDMLLRFAAAPGATTQEKFQTYLQAESQAGKGRAEKINETAAALAINDYVAGKRSKENLAQTLAAVDYKIDKTLKGSVPQPDDDWRTAVFKAAGKDDSISSDKTLGKALAGKFGKSVGSIQVKEIADINTDKVKEDFIVGFNIVTLKDGNKVIVEKSASGEIKIRDDLPVY
jgi:hypothetical protein